MSIYWSLKVIEFVLGESGRFLAMKQSGRFLKYFGPIPSAGILNRLQAHLCEENWLNRQCDSQPCVTAEPVSLDADSHCAEWIPRRILSLGDGILLQPNRVESGPKRLGRWLKMTLILFYVP